MLANRTPSQTKKLGFTLLEMLAATILASLLFVALTSVLRSFAKQERWVEDKSERQPPVQILEQMLRRDLTNAQYVDYGPTGIRLLGTIAQDWTSRQPTGRRAEVVYRLANIAGESWLLRREVHLDATSTQRAREEPVWAGVVDMKIEAEQTTLANDDSTTSLPAIPGMLPAPSRMAIVLLGTKGQPLLNMKVLHHWEDF